MSFANPTHLRIGMHGNFGGKDYRVLGRVVMGETEGGETYYWSEFNLQSNDGGYADLVYEETERGGEWRLFTMFEPEYPMTAADAATKRVGDLVNLTGEDVRITLCSKSRVYYIEGKAPEGVEVGDVANYFNALAGEEMQVVSWTGEDVEYYNGVNIPQSVVATAFKLPRASEVQRFSGTGSSWLSGNDEHYDGAVKFLLKFALLIFFFFIFFGRHFSWSFTQEASPVKKTYAGGAPLKVGATGNLLARDYHVAAHAVMDIAEVGAHFERHEYQLTNDDGQVALLVCGLSPDDKDWQLFEPLMVVPLPPPQYCASKKTGDRVEFGGLTGTVRGLFLATVRQVDGAPPADWQLGEMRFGFTAPGEPAILLARWNGAGVSLERGTIISAKTAAAALAPPAKP
ncbi:MAG TPA: hypothetical protein VMB80_04770 [Candidatus Acidoferrum sp.]|nr:hypothetical protein [Candidatus Acidoferrum sp.]